MHFAIPLLRRARNEEGQAAALGGLLVFVAALSAMLVFTVGHRVREKVKVQSAADAAAFSLAVAEARAFNYFAFANRASVAHAVSVLSIQSHQSFITFFEGLSRQAAKSFDTIAREQKKDCDAAIAFRERMARQGRAACAGPACNRPSNCPPWEGCFSTCEDVANARAAANLHRAEANRLHRKWHNGWYHKEFMKQASRRFAAIDELYNDQYNVFEKLKKTVDVQRGNSVAVQVVRAIDPELRLLSTKQVADKNLRYLKAAVAIPDNQSEWNNFAGEWKEAVAGTRWPNWISFRQINGIGQLKRMSSIWAQTLRLANKGNETDNAALDVNINVKGSSATIGGIGKSMGALESAVVPTSSSDLGGVRGYAAYDSGRLTSINWYSWGVSNSCACRSEHYCLNTGGGDSFDAGAYSTPLKNAGFHVFPNEGIEIERDLIGSCDNCFKADMSYRGHPRFKLGAGLLANQPRSIAVVAKPWFNRSPNDQRPWEFKFTASFPTRMSFDTRGASASSEMRGYSVSVASALTYYHKPGGDGWREPPNFWNPFWRAKLHPVKPADAESVLPEWARARMGAGALKSALNH